MDAKKKSEKTPYYRKALLMYIVHGDYHDLLHEHISKRQL